MLKLSATIQNIPVMSLRTGGRVAEAIKPIINPNNLKIVGWWCDDVFSKNQLILLTEDVRDFVPQGIAINDHDDLADPEELIRLKEVLEIDYDLINKTVVTNQKRRIGKIRDYAVESESMIVQKLYVSRPIYKSISDAQISIDHSQILEVNDKKIIVKDVEIRVETKNQNTSTAMGVS